MKEQARIVSQQRLGRLMLWSRLWLLRLAGFILEAAGAVAPLERAVEAALKPMLDMLAKIIVLLISIQASQRVKARPLPKPHARGKRPPHLMRRVRGSRLRRLSRAKSRQKDDLRARIAALLSLLENAEAEIARLAKRLRAGLTRRRGGVTREHKMPVARAALFIVALCADTS